MDELVRSLKEEKAATKEAQTKITQLTDQLSEAKEESEGLAKKLEALKKKQHDASGKVEQEMEEMKASYEEQLEGLKRKVLGENFVNRQL